MNFSITKLASSSDFVFFLHSVISVSLVRVNSILASGIAFLVYYVSRIKDEASTDFSLFVD